MLAVKNPSTIINSTQMIERKIDLSRKTNPTGKQEKPGIEVNEGDNTPGHTDQLRSFKEKISIQKGVPKDCTHGNDSDDRENDHSFH